MGQDAAATVTAIEDAREQLGRDLDVLGARLPDRDEATQAAAVSAGAAVAALGSVWLGWNRYRRAKEHRELAALLHDAGVAATGARPSTSGGAWKVLLGVLAGGAIGLAGYVATRDTLRREQTRLRGCSHGSLGLDRGTRSRWPRTPDEPLWVQP